LSYAHHLSVKVSKRKSKFEPSRCRFAHRDSIRLNNFSSSLT